MTDQGTPLTSLCSICYTDPPKYVCPRDHVKTCSLPCYKRHQQRASCNGKRDPTAYVKKDKLATASGIDHDYNFLSGVERVFDKAEKDRDERGIGDGDQSLKKRWHKDGTLQRYLRQNHILVDRAPVGMSRQKSNQTRFLQKSKKIVWTVEWIDAEGVKTLSEAHEATTLGDAYAAVLADRERENKKRKRGTSADKPSKVVKSNMPSQPQKSDEAKGHAQDADLVLDTALHQAILGADVIQENLVPDPAPQGEIVIHQDRRTPQPDLRPQPDADSAQTYESGDPSDSQTNDTRSLILSRIQSEQSRQAALRASKQPTGPPYFYLLRPHTSAVSRVLIPLSSDDNLTSSLSGQTVLEFPTIYVLDQGQDDLADTFMTEDAYLKNKQEEDEQVEELLKAVPGSAAAARRGFGERDEGSARNELDPSKILEMLKRDVPT